MIKVDISKLKQVVSKMNLAIEKTKLNPKAGWIEIESLSDKEMSIKVANSDYYFESILPISCENYDSSSKVHSTVTADTFIPLISKLDCKYVEIREKSNSILLNTDKSEYTFPVIKEYGRVKSVDSIDFNCKHTQHTISGKSIASISTTNAKGVLDSVFTKEIQQYVYVDNFGALTFTENIYINDFIDSIDGEFKFLLNPTQAKLLKVFDSFDSVGVYVESNDSYESSSKVLFSAKDDYSLKIVMVVQSRKTTDKFPSCRIRDLAKAVSTTHAILEKKDIEKALQRLMVFDKKFDVTEMTYSKIVFSEDSLKLVSVKNKNFEVINYTESYGTSEHESVIRFADLVNQLKAVQGKTIDISYGDSPAIVISSNGLKQLIPEIQSMGRI